MSLTSRIEDFARLHGAEVFGVTSAKPFPKYLEMVSELESIVNLKGLPLSTRINELRGDPKNAIHDAESIIVLGVPYKLKIPADDSVKYEGPHVFLSRDIRHRPRVIATLAESIVEYLQKEGFEAKSGEAKPGGISIKAAAVRAGLGNYGENTLVYTKEFGSWVTWVGVTTNAKLEFTEVNGEDICGKCNRCLEVCPTGALYKPYKHNPLKCISYLTLPQFQVGEIPDSFKEKIGKCLCCCETCQDMCPRNKKIEPKEVGTTFDISFHGVPLPDKERLPLSNLIPVLEGEVNRYFQRYAAICIGNLEGAEEALPVLAKMLSAEDQLVRKYADWAINRIKNRG